MIRDLDEITVLLKTEEQLIKEFGFKLAVDTLIHKEKEWSISNEERSWLGEEVEVYATDQYHNVPYTHRSVYAHHYWHESWFEKVIDKDDEWNTKGYEDNNPHLLSKDRYLMLLRFVMFAMRGIDDHEKIMDAVVKMGKKHNVKRDEVEYVMGNSIDDVILYLNE